MEYNYGEIFRILRENKNITLSSLADEYVSKGMISKFERDESEISVSRFFHLLNKIKITPDEFFFYKNQYQSEGFGEIVSIIQQGVLSGNTKIIKSAMEREKNKYLETRDSYVRLNYIMIEAVLKGIDSSSYRIDSKDLDFIVDYLFKCENWGYYELVLYGNSMSVFPIESIILFSKAIPQKILLMKNSGRILEIGFNVILNSLGMCIQFNKQKAAQYFLESLENLNMPETMLFEYTLLKLYKGAYLCKFHPGDRDGKVLIENALTIFKLADSLELYDVFSKNLEEMLV